MDSKALNSTHINQNLLNLINNLIISMMMACVAISVILIVQKVIPGWDAFFLPVVIFFIALERMTTYRKVQRLMLFSKSWFLFHFTQWAGILLVLKLLLLIVSPPESWRMLFQLWRIDFAENFFDAPFILASIFVIVIWILTGFFASLINEMSLDEALLKFETAIMAPVEDPPPRERLLSIVFGLGFLLVILTALLRVNFRMVFQGESIGSLGLQPLPYLAAGAWNVLLYFFLGLVLVSISQLARLNARWHFQKIEVSPKLARKWAIYSISFIFLLSFGASLLPTNYSLGFLSVLAYLLKLIWSFVYFIFGLLFSLLLFIISQIALLLGVRPVENEPSPPPDFVIPDVPTEILTNGSDPWLELIKSLIFWIVFLGVAGFSLVQFVRQHDGILNTLKDVPGGSWLVKIWQWLLGMFKGFNHRISILVTSNIERIRSQRKGLEKRSDFRRVLRVNSLTPRKRIFYFFFRMLRRSETKGLTRRDSQTPYEYAHTLEQAIPEVGEDVVRLTNTFVEARYSRKEINEEHVSIVKRYWGRIRAALRSIQK